VNMNDEKAYQFGKSRLIIKFGDLTSAVTDVIVSSDDAYLSMGGGVSASILRAGGDVIARDARKNVPCQMGDVVVTSAGKLEAKYVFHAITIDWSQKDEFTVEKSINSIIKKSLNVLSVLGLKSIAFPAIGTGAARYSLEDVAHFMSMAISEFLSNSDEELEIYIYLMDRYGRRTAIDYIVFFEQFYRRMFTSGVDIAEVNPAETEAHAKQWDMKSMRLNHLNSYLIKLEEQRMNFEMKLIEAIEKNDNEQIKTLHYQLDENNKIRYSCMREIKEVECTDALNSSFKSVFLSSTFEDMKEYRKAIIDRIIKRRMVPICMENWGANANKVTSVITDEVKKADIYLGIFGTRYGYVDENTNMSMTEIEYREALASNKPILVYIAKNAKDDITTGDNSQKMLELLTEIEKERIVYYFNSIDQLGEQVFADLERYIK
jgi:O-acetyl-ADP-ribose deacetylase (regulator of RNase III)